MHILERIELDFKPKQFNSVEFFYDEMESQSDYSLPIIYKPFNGRKKTHWCDRGWIWDFLLSLKGEEKKIMDFGPGDGWPSLLIAPYIDKIIGVDGSRRRINVCRKNAEKLDISNVEFIHVQPGNNLPFPNNSFDGITAASSIEQTPDPESTLKELHRVLCYGGRMRIEYEALNQYKNKRENEIYLDEIINKGTRIILYKRFIEREFVEMYSMIVNLSRIEFMDLLNLREYSISYNKFESKVYNKLKPYIIDVKKCHLIHPSGKTMISLMRKAGFSKIFPTHNGGLFAGKLFDIIPENERPVNMDEIDKLLKPLIKIIVEMLEPIDNDPVITAVK